MRFIFSPEDLSEAFRAGEVDNSKTFHKVRLLLSELTIELLHASFCVKDFLLLSW